MPKPHNSFAEGLHKLAADIASLELAPDADASLIQALREPILAYMKQGSPQAGQQPGPQGPQAGPQAGPQGMPIPMPTTEGDMSRGPTPNPDMSGAVSELQRVMAGS